MNFLLLEKVANDTNLKISLPIGFYYNYQHEPLKNPYKDRNRTLTMSRIKFINQFMS